MRIIDSHLHLWDPNLIRFDWLDGALNQRFGPDELARATADLTGERAFVFVQAECVPEEAMKEVRWVSELAADLPVRGIVARAAVETGEAVTSTLAELRENPLVVGVRRNIQGEAAGFAGTREFLAGARRVADAGLTFDACVTAPQVHEVIALADAVPALSIVLDHLGKPPVGSAHSPASPDATEWKTQIQRLAKRPNVTCKLSGLPAESAGQWSPDQLTPFLDVALDAFGAERLMFGSDWPVSSTAGGYSDWVTFIATWAMDALSADAADAILWRNAERVYSLG